MAPLSKLAILCLVSSLIQGCASQVEQSRPNQVQAFDVGANSKEFDPLVFEKLREFIKFRQALFTKGVECNPDAQGTCRSIVIPIIQVPDAAGNLYCVGLVPETVHIRNTGTGPRPKRIVWELDVQPPMKPWPTGSTFEFLGNGDRGIMLLQNIGNGPQEQLSAGKRGSRPSNNDPDKFHMRNEHFLQGAAVYLPIIVQRIPATLTEPEKVALCGTPDPRILND